MHQEFIGISQIQLTFSEDYGVHEDDSRQEILAFGKLEPNLAYNFTPLTNFSQDRALIGLTSVQFDTEFDERIRKLGMIYFSCGNWTPPGNDEIVDPDVNDGEEDSEQGEGQNQASDLVEEDDNNVDPDVNVVDEDVQQDPANDEAN